MDRTVMDVICPTCNRIIEGVRTYTYSTPIEGPWHPDCVPQLIPTAQQRKGERRDCPVCHNTGVVDGNFHDDDGNPIQGADNCSACIGDSRTGNDRRQV